MIKLLNSLYVFEIVLKLLSIISKTEKLDFLTNKITRFLALLNVKINRHKEQDSIKSLAETWQNMMPNNSQHLFKIEKLTEDTAYVQIHLECPLRSKGNTLACYKLMNYDRSLMKSIGGKLVILESQANSGKNYCRLAIRKSNQDISDLTPAHKK